MKSLISRKACELGDFQTPAELAEQALAWLKKIAPNFAPQTIIEPTCSIGTFLVAEV